MARIWLLAGCWLTARLSVLPSSCVPRQTVLVSNLEDKPDELVCEAARGGIEVLTPREVPLGGPRAMTVRRTLPQRERSLIGAWCFLDHYGPDHVTDSGGMSVAPHPHTGLQTVSWLFTGEIEHRDSAGHHAMVRPGELNLMTAGHGISHSEVSTPETSVLHGAQLWVALPSSARDDAPTFDHYAPAAVTGEGWEARVFLGSLLGDTSPVATATPAAGRRAAAQRRHRAAPRRRPGLRARCPGRHRRRLPR